MSIRVHVKYEDQSILLGIEAGWSFQEFKNRIVQEFDIKCDDSGDYVLTIEGSEVRSLNVVDRGDAIMLIQRSHNPKSIIPAGRNAVKDPRSPAGGKPLQQQTVTVSTSLDDSSDLSSIKSGPEERKSVRNASDTSKKRKISSQDYDGGESIAGEAEDRKSRSPPAKRTKVDESPAAHVEPGQKRVDSEESDELSDGDSNYSDEELSITRKKSARNATPSALAKPRALGSNSSHPRGQRLFNFKEDDIKRLNGIADFEERAKQVLDYFSQKERFKAKNVDLHVEHLVMIFKACEDKKIDVLYHKEFVTDCGQFGVRSFALKHASTHFLTRIPF
jgi:hypothetical protein